MFRRIGYWSQDHLTHSTSQSGWELQKIQRSEKSFRIFGKSVCCSESLWFMCLLFTESWGRYSSIFEEVWGNFTIFHHTLSISACTGSGQIRRLVNLIAILIFWLSLPCRLPTMASKTHPIFTGEGESSCYFFWYSWYVSSFALNSYLLNVFISPNNRAYLMPQAIFHARDPESYADDYEKFREEKNYVLETNMLIKFDIAVRELKAHIKHLKLYFPNQIKLSEKFKRPWLPTDSVNYWTPNDHREKIAKKSERELGDIEMNPKLWSTTELKKRAISDGLYLRVKLKRLWGFRFKWREWLLMENLSSPRIYHSMQSWNIPYQSAPNINLAIVLENIVSNYFDSNSWKSLIKQFGIGVNRSSQILLLIKS